MKDMHDQQTAHGPNRISKIKIRQRAKELRMTDWVRGDGNGTGCVLLLRTCFAASFTPAMVKSEKKAGKKIPYSERGGGLRALNVCLHRSPFFSFWSTDWIYPLVCMVRLTSQDSTTRKIFT